MQYTDMQKQIINMRVKVRVRLKFTCFENLKMISLLNLLILNKF